MPGTDILHSDIHVQEVVIESVTETRNAANFYIPAMATPVYRLLAYSKFRWEVYGK